jgi:hypothetical protein
MNLHGYSSTHDVVENACDLHNMGRLVCESGRWWWSGHKADSVLRTEGVTPRKLRDRFAARGMC